ncbi:hypothetical protein GCM10028777_10290 [Angustibacter speluncae]
MLLALAVLVPAAVAAGLAQVRSVVEGPAAALVLVLVVVAAASTGSRWAGLVSAVSAAASFNWFLTVPYASLVIADRDDVEVAVLLALVGLAVTEIALWGRRQQDRASRTAGLVEGVATAMGGVGDDNPDRVHDIAARLQTVLGVEAVGYDPGPVRTDEPVLGADGVVRIGPVPLDVVRDGLPTDAHVQVPVDAHDRGGRFLVAGVGVGRARRPCRPSLSELHLAAVLARGLGAAMEHPAVDVDETARTPNR